MGEWAREAGRTRGAKEVTKQQWPDTAEGKRQPEKQGQEVKRDGTKVRQGAKKLAQDGGKDRRALNRKGKRGSKRRLKAQKSAKQKKRRTKGVRKGRK